jgi:hypothetical protein
MVITCVNNALLGIHGCLTVADVLSHVIGPSGLIIMIVKTVMVKRMTGEGKNGLPKRVVLHKLHFFHVFHRHQSENIGVCEQGKCTIVQLK